MSTEADRFLLCRTRADLARLLEVKTSTLTYFAFGKGRSYVRFEIPKKGGGTRLISTPAGGLMEIQRRLARIFNEIYSPPSYVQGFVRGGSIVKNASIHLNKKMVLNFDLKDFFPSISAGRVIGLLRAQPFNFNNEIASTIAGLVCYEDSLPQGAPTSTVISNMICLRMDKAMYRLCRSERVFYSRYADDITLSTMKPQFSSTIIEQRENNTPVILGTGILEIIRTNYFDINHKKTRISIFQQPKYVTGVKVNHKPNLPRPYIRRIRSMLHAWEKWGVEQAAAEFSDKYNGGSKSFINVIRGRIAHVKNVKGENDLVYRRLYNRFVRLEAKGRPELPESEIEELYSRVFVTESGAERATGFILNNRWFITCAHAVASQELEYYLHSDFAPVVHKRLWVDYGRISPVDTFDLAAFELQPNDTTKYSSLEIAPPGTEVRVWDTYKVIGFPQYVPGSQPHISPITVTNIQKDKSGVLMATVDRKMISGSSGSPVLNHKNQVVGVVQRGTLDRSTGDNDVGYKFLPIQEFNRCIKQLEILSIMDFLSERYR